MIALFSTQITLGSVLAIVAAIGGVVGLRAAFTSIWRENYEGEKEARVHAEHEATRQRELKHAALGELAAAKLRTDVSLVASQLRDVEERLTMLISGISECLGRVGDTQDRQTRVLEAIEQRLSETRMTA